MDTDKPKPLKPEPENDAGGTYAQRDMSRSAKRSAFRQKPASSDPSLGTNPDGPIAPKPTD